MGDWLETKPQFPRGMKPVLDDDPRRRLHARPVDRAVHGRQPLAALRRASRLGGEGPRDRRAAGADDLLRRVPLAQAQRGILRPRRHPSRRPRPTSGGCSAPGRGDWGCGYFKADFMHLGSIYGPDEARWHRHGPVAHRDLDADGAADPRGDRRGDLARLRRAGLGAGRAGRRHAHRPRHRRVAGRGTIRPSRCCATRRRATSPTASCGRPTPTASCCATASTS